ncbi:MAG: flagellar brake protein [Paucibacter sp.]|nr:flagellar brake protein [Roseateles sp.]
MFRFRSTAAQQAAPAPAAQSEEPVEAIAPIDAGLEVTPYRIGEAAAVAATLCLLADDADLVSFHLGDGAAPLAGRIVEVLPALGRMVIEASCQVAPGARAATCVAMPRGVKLQFQTELQWLPEEGAAAPGLLRGTAALPDQIIHLQRRSTPRLDVPLGATLRAEFTVLGRPRIFSVDDLSLGGVGLRGPVEEGHSILVGQTLAARLVLEDRTALTVPLEVRSRRPFRSFLAGPQLHLGCRFAGLSDAASGELRALLERLEMERRRGRA